MAKNKRITVIRMLKNRLADSKLSLRLSHEYEFDTDMMGGNYDDKKEKQLRINMQTDIGELNYLIWCLKNRDAIKEMFGEYGA